MIRHKNGAFPHACGWRNVNIQREITRVQVSHFLSPSVLGQAQGWAPREVCPNLFAPQT